MAYVYSSANLTAGLAPTTNISYMLRDVHSIVTTGSAFDLSIPDYANIRIDGDITAGTHAFTDAGSTNIFQSFRIHVLPTSLIQTQSYAISLGATDSLPLSGGRFRLINEGEIISADGGVRVFGGTMTLANSGQITSVDDSAVALYASNRNPGNFFLNNSGTLATTSTGPGRSDPTVLLNASEFGRVWFVNDGLIEADEGRAISVTASYTRITNSGTIDGGIDVHSSADTVRIVNSGAIGVNDNGVSLYLPADDVWINNSGVVEGNVVAQGLSVGTGQVTILNSGIFFQDVTLGTEDDLYQAYGTGSVVGTVYGGAGFDRLFGGDLNDRLDGGAGFDTLRGGAGNDSLTGGHDPDMISGGADNDTLDGGFGEDTLLGDAGDDLLLGGTEDDFGRGGTGNDVIYAGTDNDWFYGGFGNDTMYGEEGDDRLYGDRDDDVIDGGLGRDIIHTGQGADVIVFNTLADSAVGAQRDVIEDFTVGIDTIDVSAILAGTFDFVGTGALTGTAPELRLAEMGGSTVVQMDADGDGLADSEILLRGATGLTADDFVL